MSLKPVDRERVQKRSVRPSQPETNTTIEVPEYVANVIARVDEIVAGTGRRMLPGMSEVVLRCLNLDDHPANVEDVFLWLYKQGIKVGNSSVRSALASLCRDGMAKVVPAPIDAVRPGPRSEFYQITDLGRDVLKKTDELLNLIPVPSNPKRKEMA